jgi:hypothetical protein
MLRAKQANKEKTSSGLFQHAMSRRATLDCVHQLQIRTFQKFKAEQENKSL